MAPFFFRRPNFCVTLHTKPYLPEPLYSLCRVLGPKQAVENVGELLTNVLRTRGRLENTAERLRELKVDDEQKAYPG